MDAFLTTAVRKALIAWRERRLSYSPLTWIRLLRHLALERRGERESIRVAAAEPPAVPPTPAASDASTVPAVDGEALRLALAAFLWGLAAWVVAVRQALDVNTGRAVWVCVLAVLVNAACIIGLVLLLGGLLGGFGRGPGAVGF